MSGRTRSSARWRTRSRTRSGGAALPTSSGYDAVVVGAGPNGLAAAVTLARAGRSVLVVEAADEVGGGTRSKELTLPGFVHDVCSAIHPLAVASPFLRSLPLERYGLEWIQPPLPLAHPLDGGRVAVQHRSLQHTADGLGADGRAYRRLMQALVRRWEPVVSQFLGPQQFLGPSHRPQAPLALVRFGWQALRSADTLATRRFDGEEAKALIAGVAAHALQPLSNPLTAGFGLLTLCLGHAVGWPLAKGGSQRIANALTAHLADLGGKVITGTPVRSLADLPAARAVLLDVTPRQLLAIAGDRLPGRYRRRLERFRHNPGVFKVDWALDGPVPWSVPACGDAGTVHIGGTLAEIAAAEEEVAAGRHPSRPFVLLAQQSLFDGTRAPTGGHTLWGYTHVPNGSEVDMTEAIEAQIERFAPGFRDRILARHVMAPAALEAYNDNYVGGDISGGRMDLWQMLARPAPRFNPYRTPADGIYLCSASTPPGGGVHGMCGYWAARSALRRLR